MCVEWGELGAQIQQLNINGPLKYNSSLNKINKIKVSQLGFGGITQQSMLVFDGLPLRVGLRTVYSRKTSPQKQHIWLFKFYDSTG